MVRKAVVILFLSGLIGVAFWFSIRAGVDLVRYVRIDRSVEPETISWEIEQRGRSHFRLRAHFSFLVDGKRFESDALLPRRGYRNHWAAAAAKDKLERELIWYAPSNPNLTALRRAFPVKSSVHALMILGILLYFSWIGLYITRNKGLVRLSE